MIKSKHIINLFPIFFILIGTAQEKNSRELSNVYKAYKVDKSVVNLKAFYSAFPTSFVDLQKFYGYSEISGAAPYYTAAKEHLNVFFKSSKAIDVKSFSKKLVAISKNGRWEADAENYFQEGLRVYFFSHSKAMIDLLNTKKRNEIISFWYFFSDGPHFDEKVHEKVMTVIKVDSFMKRCYLEAVQHVKMDNIH